jgi:hypothetical protein
MLQNIYLTVVWLEVLATAKSRGKYGAKDFDTETVHIYIYAGLYV